LSYSKLVAPTNTNLTLAAYRYSTSGYLGLSDAMLLRDQNAQGLNFANPVTPRGRLQVMLNQSLPQGFGSFFLSGSTQDYWNRPGRDTQYQAGYNNSYRHITFGISASRQLNTALGQWDNQFMLTVSMPLGDEAYAPYSSTRVQHGPAGANSVQQTVTGTAGANHGLSYGLNAGYTNSANGNSSSFGGNVGYTSPVAMFGASASTGQGYTQMSASMTGGVVAYAGGVSFGPILGDTLAVVEARNATGAHIVNGNGLRVDRRGHALVSNLVPFSHNQIEIDPKGLPMNVEFKSTTQSVAPTAGAVVQVKFETVNTGRAVVFAIRQADGSPLPFGTEVLDANDQPVGVVAQGGRAIVRGLTQDSGMLKVATSDGGYCALPYRLPATTQAKPDGMQIVDAQCQAVSQ
jgi:outer membrane usher protein